MNERNMEKIFIAVTDDGSETGFISCNCLRFQVNVHCHRHFYSFSQVHAFEFKENIFFLLLFLLKIAIYRNMNL